jgi:tRNA A-37 threonylcarbamoyl transferase component Bud32
MLSWFISTAIALARFKMKGWGEASSGPVGSPRLNACLEIGKLAARLHAQKALGLLDLTNFIYEPDGTPKALVSIGRGRFLEHALTIEERANDLATLKQQLSVPEWEAAKIAYRLGAPDDAEEVLRHVEPPIR